MGVRALALLVAALLLAGPVRAFFAAPEVLVAAKAAWLVLAAAGLLPAWRAPVLLALTPFLPWLPFAVPGMPHGVVHLLVLSQALPWLIGVARGAAVERLDPIGRSWLLLLLVAASAGVPYYAALGTQFDGVLPFAADVAEQLSGYVLLSPSIEFSNIIVAVSAIGDGVLTWLIVRSSPEPPARLVAAVAVAAIGVAAVGAWQAYSGTGLRFAWRVNDPYITRINATFSDPNALAAYLSAALPLVFALAGRTAGTPRLAWMGGGLLVGTSLVLTAGRAGALAAVAGVAILAAVALRLGLDRRDASAPVRRGFRHLTYGLLALAVTSVALLVVVGTVIDARHHQQQSYLDTWLYTFNLRGPLDETVKGRLGIWRTVGRIVADHPVFGVGPGRIFRVFPSYSQDEPGLPQGLPLSAHDTFLNIAAELGLVGLAAWLLLVGSTLHAAWRGLFPPGGAPDAESWIGAGLLGAWCACLLTMTTGDRTILREDLVVQGALTALVARRMAWPPAGATGRRVAILAALVLVVAMGFRMRAERDAVAMDRVTAGMHPIERERDGRSFRWTTGRAVFHVASSLTTVTVTVRSLAPFPQRVEVLVERTPVAVLNLTEHDWVPTRLVLPKTRGRYHRLELRVSPTWQAPRDGRELGVMLAWEGR